MLIFIPQGSECLEMGSNTPSPFKRFEHRRSNISDSLESAPAVNRLAPRLLSSSVISLMALRGRPAIDVIVIRAFDLPIGA